MVTAPTWLSSGDTAWQMTAATLVGLMSVPGLVVLYGGVMQKRWSINSMMLAFAAFAVVLVVWVLWAFKMGFGNPIGHGHGFFSTFIGKPGPVLGHTSEQGAHDPHFDPLRGLADQSQGAQLLVGREAIARLAFNGGGPGRQRVAQAAADRCPQLSVAGGARGGDGAQDSAARGGDSFQPGCRGERAHSSYVPGTQVRVLTPTMFQALIAITRLTSAAISSGEYSAATAAYALVGT